MFDLRALTESDRGSLVKRKEIETGMKKRPAGARMFACDGLSCQHAG